MEKDEKKEFRLFPENKWQKKEKKYSLSEVSLKQAAIHPII